MYLVASPNACHILHSNLSPKPVTLLHPYNACSCFLPMFLQINHPVVLIVNGETEEQVIFPCAAQPHPHENCYVGQHLQFLSGPFNSQVGEFVGGIIGGPGIITL